MTVDKGSADRDVTVNCTVTCDNPADSGSATAATVSVTVTPAPLAISMLPPPQTPAGNDIAVSAIVTGGKEPYGWKWELVNPGTGMIIEDDTSANGCTIKTTSASIDASGCEIKLTITDANTDTATDSKAVEIIAAKRKTKAKSA